MRPGRAGARISRRQAMGRMSAVATAGAAAWVVPEILLAKPAAGATLSGNVSTQRLRGRLDQPLDPVIPASGGRGAGGTLGTNGPEGVTTAAGSDHPNSLAFTGLNIQRDAEVGAALVAGGWAMQHWASRTPKPARRRRRLAMPVVHPLGLAHCRPARAVLPLRRPLR